MDTLLFEARRGAVVESVSTGAFAITDANGKLLFSGGDPMSLAYLRSSAKPFQVLPFVEEGGMEVFSFTEDELSLSCASHEGGVIHLTTVTNMQRKADIQENQLQCGGHIPAAACGVKELNGRKPTANYNNCSGKHTTMLACAKLKNFSLTDYLLPSHPLQQEIKQIVGEMCGMDEKRIIVATDGCSAPTFALPLYNSALGFALLCDPPSIFSEKRQRALKRIATAMYTHPEMIQGVGGFDSELMRVGGGKIVSKRGAEGLQLIGLMPGVYSASGIGIAIKVADGDPSYRVRTSSTLEILRQLNVLDASQLRALSRFGPVLSLKNWIGLPTGEGRAVCKL